MSSIPMTSCEWRVGPPGQEEVRIVERAQRDGTVLYAVTWRSWVATHGREWEFEPIPSSRDDEFIARCRFASWEDAARVAQYMARGVLAQKTVVLAEPTAESLRAKQERGADVTMADVPKSICELLLDVLVEHGLHTPVPRGIKPPPLVVALYQTAAAYYERPQAPERPVERGRDV